MHELSTVVYVIDTVENICREQELKIEKIKAVTYCQNCKQTYDTMIYKKICPYCGSGNTFLITGNEYNIKEIEAQ